MRTFVKVVNKVEGTSKTLDIAAEKLAGFGISLAFLKTEQPSIFERLTGYGLVITKGVKTDPESGKEVPTEHTAHAYSFKCNAGSTFKGKQIRKLDGSYVNPATRKAEMVEFDLTSLTARDVEVVKCKGDLTLTPGVCEEALAEIQAARGSRPGKKGAGSNAAAVAKLMEGLSL